MYQTIEGRKTLISLVKLYIDCSGPNHKLNHYFSLNSECFGEFL